jgi:hypothetical protein
MYVTFIYFFYNNPAFTVMSCIIKHERHITVFCAYAISLWKREIGVRSCKFIVVFFFFTELFLNTIRLSKEYGSIFRFWLGPRLCVLLIEPMHVEVRTNETGIYYIKTLPRSWIETMKRHGSHLPSPSFRKRLNSMKEGLYLEAANRSSWSRNQAFLCNPEVRD